MAVHSVLIRSATLMFCRVRGPFLVGAISLVANACGFFSPGYSADPITAWVVDAETGKPIEGVSVVASWELLGGMFESQTVGFLKVMETVSDSSGKFSFPGWGPGPMWTLDLLEDGTPVLQFFKSGYSFHSVRNLGVVQRAPRHMQSSWNGKTIKLQRFNGSLEDYSWELDLSLAIHIDFLLSKTDCGWKAIPKFLWAADQQDQIFTANKTRYNLGGLKHWSDRYSNQCGSLKTYVEEHGKRDVR